MPTTRTIRIARHLTADRAMELLREEQAKDGAGYGALRVELDDFAAAWNPASTKHEIYGPCNLEYSLYPDGGVTLHVLD